MKKKKNYYKYLILLISILFIVLVVAIPSVIEITTPEGTTFNNSVIIEYNVSCDAPPCSGKFSWDGVNYTLPFDGDPSLVLSLQMNNFSALGEWFNETGCLAVDTSRYSNNGSCYGGQNISWTPTSVNSKYGGAFNFSGKVNYVQLANVIPSKNYNFTISMWFKIFSSGNNQLWTSATGNSDRFGIFVSNNELRAGLYNGAFVGNKSSSTSAIQLNTWYHIVYVWNKEIADGNLTINKVEQTLRIIPQTSGTVQATIGKTAGAGYLNGSVDDVMIWNRTLSTSEINQLDTSQLTKYDSQNWSFYSNQTLNYSTSILNASSPTYDYNYYLCSSNSSGSENCSSQKIITQTIPNKNIIANFTTSVGIIRNDFYCVNVGTVLSGSNKVKYRQDLLNANINCVKFNLFLQNHYSNTSNSNGVNFTGDFSGIIDEMNWLKENSITANVIIDYMPSWLADNSSGKCNDLTLCPSSNYTKYNNIINDSIYRITNNGDINYLNVIKSVEIWNEPDNSAFFLGGGTLTTRANNYSIMFSNVSSFIRTNYPTFSIFGPIISRQDQSTFWVNFLSLYNQSIDGYDFHFYMGVNPTWGTDMYTQANTQITNVTTACGIYSANCSRIIVGEWNDASATNYLNYNLYANEIAGGYIALLQLPSNISSYFFSLSANDQYGMINLTSYRASYNVTKSFANNHRAGDTIYNSSSDDSDIKIVSSNKDNFYAITIINSGTTSKNITLNGTSTPSNKKAYLMNKDTGTLYLTNNSNQLGIKDSYDITYLVTPNFTLTEGSNLTKLAPTGESYNSNELNLSKSTFTSGGIDKTTYLLSSSLKISVNSTLNLSTSCLQTGDTIKYTSNSLDNSYTPSYSCSGNRLIVTINDYEPATNSNELIITYKHLPQGAGGTGITFFNYSSNNTKLICNEIYYFLIEKINNTKITYNLNDLNLLSSKILTKIGLTIPPSEIEYYINNYNSVCNFTNLTLPSPLIIVYFSNQSYLEECNISINKKFLFGLIDFEKSLNCWWKDCGIIVGEKTCEELKKDIWLWNYEKVGDIYVLKGIRAYIFVIGIFFVLIFGFLSYILWYKRQDRVLNRKIYKYEKSV